MAAENSTGQENDATKGEGGERKLCTKWDHQWQNDFVDFLVEVLDKSSLDMKTFSARLRFEPNSSASGVDSIEDWVKRRYNKRAEPDVDIAKAVVEFVRKTPVNVQIPASVRDLLTDPEAHRASASSRDEENGNLGLDIKIAVGITTDITERSIAHYRGRYWMVYWSENDLVAVLLCALDGKARHGVPVYKAWRNSPQGRKVQLGSYFVDGDTLSLTGTKASIIDIRLAILHCNPGGDADSVLYGWMLYKDGHGVIVQTRVVLFRDSALPDEGPHIEAEPDIHTEETVARWFGEQVSFVLAERPTRLPPRS